VVIDTMELFMLILEVKYIWIQ